MIYLSVFFFLLTGCVVKEPNKLKLKKDVETTSEQPTSSNDALYKVNCMSCHGPLNSSSKLNRSYTQISNSISSIPSMSFLRKLSSEEIYQIEKELSFNPPQIDIQNNNFQLESGVTQTSITVRTDEYSYCSYSLEDIAFGQMRTMMNSAGERRVHSFSLAVSSSQNYKYYIRCSDKYANSNPFSEVLSFSVKSAVVVDSTPPVLTELSPNQNTSFDYNTNSFPLRVNTNEISTCRHSNNANAAFSGMTNFQNSNTLAHSYTYDISTKGLHQIYIKCSDTSGNISAVLKLTVSASSEPNVYDGKQLYQQNCMACHLAIDISPKRNRSLLQIQNAIAQVGAMKSLSTLTVDELKAIEAELALVVDTPGDEVEPNVTSRAVLQTRRYIESKFKTIFANNNSSANQPILNIIDDFITNDKNGYLEGICTAYETDCPDTSHMIKLSGSMSPFVSSLRRGSIVKTCDSVTNLDQSIYNVLTLISVGTDKDLSSARLDKLLDLFYPGIDISSEAKNDLLDLYTQSKSSGLSRLRSWKIVISAMCQSTLFEIF